MAKDRFRVPLSGLEYMNEVCDTIRAVGSPENDKSWPIKPFSRSIWVWGVKMMMSEFRLLPFISLLLRKNGSQRIFEINSWEKVRQKAEKVYFSKKNHFWSTGVDQC